MATTKNTLKKQIMKAALNRPVKGLTVREAWDKGIGTTYSSVRARMYELAAAGDTSESDVNVLYSTNTSGETVKRNGATVFFAV